MQIVRPEREHLPGYVDALERGWTPDGTAAGAQRALRVIRETPDDFLRGFDDPHALAGPVRLPDGSLVARLPSIGRWIWDGEFCGAISMRWAPDTMELPPTCLGHIGYSVVPWKQRRGYATAALALMLDAARERAFPYVEIVTTPDNAASQRVIVANGGVFLEEFDVPPQVGGGRAYRFRIAL